MKRLLIACIALLTVPLFAQTRMMQPRPGMKYVAANSAKIRQAPSEPGRLARLMAQYEAARFGRMEGQGGLRVRPQAVADGRSARLLLFPAAGNARGAGGEFFRSDLLLANFDSVDQDILVLWLQNGANTNDPPAFVLTLDAQTYNAFTDFVGETLHLTGQLGAIYMIPVDGEDIDFDAAIDGFSRIWTEQPSNPIGTVSQPFPAVDPYSFYVFDTATLLGVKNDTQYRTNFGIVNVDDVAHTFNLRFLGESATNTLTLTVPALGMIQQPVPAANYGNLVIEVDVDDPFAPWIPYASSTDNRTGDGWVTIGSALFTPEDLDDIGQ